MTKTKAKRKASRKRIKESQKQEALSSGKEEIVNAAHITYTNEANKRVTHYITELSADEHLSSTNPYANIETSFRPINVKHFDKLVAAMNLRVIGKHSRHTETFIDKTSVEEFKTLERSISLYTIRLRAALVGKQVLQTMLKQAESQSPKLAQRYLELKEESERIENERKDKKAKSATHFAKKPKETKDEKRARLLQELAALDD